jgi:hypothetical protein
VVESCQRGKLIASSLGRDRRLVFSESTTHTHEMKLILDE